MKYLLHLLVAVIAFGASDAQALNFTVGPDGTFSTIQSGIDAALLAADNNTVKVEAGSYTENLSLTTSSAILTVSGGWDSTFSVRSTDPTVTTISGGVTDRVLNATLTGGELTVQGFLVVGGTAQDRGGGIHLVLSNSAIAFVVQTNFSLNTVQTSGGGNVLGGAFYAELHNTSGVTFDTNHVTDNSATAASGVASGGGVFIEALDSSQAFVFNSVFQGNVAAATGAGGTGGLASAGAAEISLSNNAKGVFINNQVLANSLQASGGSRVASSSAFFSAGCDGNCSFDIEQSVFDQNSGSGAAQLSATMGSTTAMPTAYLANLLVSRSDGPGMEVQMDGGSAHLVNLTVADNPDTGIYLVPNSTITLFNTLAFHNGTNLTVIGNPAQQGNNLIGVDPHFVDATHGNYRLQGNSSARDAGDDSPPGGLPSMDLDGNTRVFGPHVDIGAYEIGDEIFKNGFE